VVDVTTADPDVKFNIVSASKNGSITGKTVTWPDLDRYTPGEPPHRSDRRAQSAVRLGCRNITDTATATTVLGNCKGNASANAASLTGLATLETAALTGRVFSSTATTAEAARVLPATATGPAPIGGVQTGAGGTSHRSRQLLPLGAGLGSVALAGFVTRRRRRRIG
jgi:hypothetical protein